MAKAKAKRKPAVKAKKPAPAKAKRGTKNQGQIAGVGPFPGKGDLVALMGNLADKQTEISELRGAMGNAVALSVKQSGTNKWALGIVRRLKSFSRPVMTKNLKHLLKYIDDAGLTAAANQQMDLFAAAAKAGVKEPTPLEKAIKVKKATKPKIEAPEDVPAAPPPTMPEGERPPIAFN